MKSKKATHQVGKIDELSLETDFFAKNADYTRNLYNDFARKDDLKQFATKEDLKRVEQGQQEIKNMLAQLLKR